MLYVPQEPGKEEFVDVNGPQEIQVVPQQVADCKVVVKVRDLTCGTLIVSLAAEPVVSAKVC